MSDKSCGYQPDDKRFGPCTRHHGHCGPCAHPDEVGLDKSFLDAVHEEAWKAVMDHGNFNSDHEAFAVMLEEVEEVKDWVWRKRKDRDKSAMRRELVQVAAVCWKWFSQLRECEK